MILALLFSDPIVFVAWSVAMVISLSVHEFAHAYAAVRLGDPTPEQQGRLTLNPMAHLDFMGTLLLLTVGFGWGKPVLFNPYNIKNQRWGEAIVAVAGPLSNLLLATVMFFLLKFLVPGMSVGADNMMVVFFVLMFLMNLILLAFNLIPIPPLDGSKILFAFLPDNLAHIRRSLEIHGPMLLLGLLILDSFSPLPVFDLIFNRLFSFAFSLL